jgi:hypothetical protein
VAWWNPTTNDVASSTGPSLYGMVRPAAIRPPERARERLHEEIHGYEARADRAARWADSNAE